MDAETQKLHALLYANGGEVKRSYIESTLDVSSERLHALELSLATHLEDSGLEVVSTEACISLRTARTQAEFVRSIVAQEQEGDIGAAGLEILAIVLYKGRASRATIDYVRGYFTILHPHPGDVSCKRGGIEVFSFFFQTLC